ncbi:piggyBac transposable element-derived protein 4-like [Bemisia tabaci]|uniref:piggyBac transposable element-derived protein 4-like n=1 Tax=Bemisia tabaci TaxID=7038 RepID=UPI003B280299
MSAKGVLNESEIRELVTQSESESENEDFELPVEDDDSSGDTVSIQNSVENIDDIESGVVDPDNNVAESEPVHELSSSDDEFNFDTANIKWKSKKRRPSPHPFTQVNVGYNSNLTCENRELDFFKEFFNEDLMVLIVTETNNFVDYAGEAMGRVGRYSSFAKWTDLTVDELYLFFGVWLLVSVHGLNDIRDCWSTRDILNVPIFSKLMSRDRFLAILKFLHFSSNNEQPKNDRMYKIRAPFEKLRQSFKDLYTPFQNLSIDESLLLFKGRLSFKQFIKTKRARFGIKFYKLCQSDSGYIWDIMLYLGAKTEIADKYHIGKSGAIVTTLLEPLFKKGYNVFVDNYYTSPTLAVLLRQKGSNICGTVKKNRKGMPIFPPLQKGEVFAKFSDGMMALKYTDKRDVHMLSTIDKFSMAEPPKKKAHITDTVLKPVCILNYNKNMGGVDHTDQLLSSTESVRRTVKWYKKVFFHLLDSSILNAHVLFQLVTNKKVSIYEYKLKIIEQHQGPKRRPSGGKPSTSETPLRLLGRHFPTFIPPTEKKISVTRKCLVCANTKLGVQKRRESRYECLDCRVTLCVAPCFQKYHTQLKF